jgi:hypothetical protein
VLKQYRSLIVFGAIIVVLLLVWIGSAVIPGLGKSEETTTTTTAAAIEPLFKTDMTAIQHLEVVNTSGSFKLIPEEVKDKDDKIVQIWSVDGKEDYPFSSSTLESLAKVAGNVYASKEIATGVTDLAAYGLDKPSATLRVHLKDGAVHEIKFGNEIPSGYYDYAMLDNSGRVCTVASSTGGRVRVTLMDLLDKAQVVGLDPNTLTSLIFERPKDDLKLVSSVKLIGEAGSGSEYLDFAIQEPVRRTGSSEGLTKLVSESTALSVVAFVELDPADLAQYGLDKPQYAFTLTTEDKTVNIKIGSKADSANYYAMSDQLPAVFTVAASTFTSVDMKVTEMMDRFVCLESIWEVSKIEADILGTTFVTEIEMTKDQRADDEGVVYTIDGENARIFSEKDKSLYSLFYQRLIGILIEGLDTAAQPVNTRDVRLVFHIKADDVNNVPAYTKIVEFARRDDYTYYVFTDGVYGGYYVDGEKAFTSNRKDNEGVLVAYKMIRYAMDHAVDGIFNTQEGYQLD